MAWVAYSLPQHPSSVLAAVAAVVSYTGARIGSSSVVLIIVTRGSYVTIK